MPLWMKADGASSFRLTWKSLEDKRYIVLGIVSLRGSTVPLVRGLVRFFLSVDCKVSLVTAILALVRKEKESTSRYHPIHCRSYVFYGSCTGTALTNV